MDNALFRKNALRKLVSPEELDYMMQVTSSKGWAALLALGAIFAAALFWGIYGVVPTTVGGEGILIGSKGIFDVQAPSSGQVMEVFVKIGDSVKNGQVVARIDQHDVVEKVKKAAADLEMQRESKQILAAQIDKEIDLRKAEFEEERKELIVKIADDQTRLASLEERFHERERLRQEGLVTAQSVLDIQWEINTLKQVIQINQNKLQDVGRKELLLHGEKSGQLRAAEETIQGAEHELVRLENLLDVTSQVVSIHAGRVMEVMVESGDFVAEGDMLLDLEEEGKDLVAVIYATAIEGKKVKPGMPVHISPSTIKPEEYGFMEGRVIRVSKFPVTGKEIMHVLKNKELVAAFMQGGDPFEIRVNLVEDPETESGFKWSSPKGPPIKVQSGTLCFAKIIVAEQPPMSLVIPLCKRTLLGIGAR